MGPVWFRFRYELRTQWRGLLALVLLVGVAGGLVLGALAGARRTDHAYPEFLESQRAYDVLVISGLPSNSFASFDLDEIAALPMVSESAQRQRHRAGRNDRAGWCDRLRHHGAPRVRRRAVRHRDEPPPHPRRPRPRRPDEVAPSFVLAEQQGLEVGDVIDASVFNEAELRQFFTDPTQIDFAAVARERFRVVGIEASPGEFPPLSEAGSTEGFLHFSPNYAKSELYAAATEGIAVRLGRGSEDVAAFKSLLERRSGGRPLFARTQLEVATATERAIAVQADALRLVAVIAAVAGALLIGLTLLRQQRLAETEIPVLRALGMSPSQLMLSALLRAVLVGTAGAVVSVFVAVAMSPLAPIGVARNAEVDPGLAVDAPVLVLGALATFAAVVAVSLPAVVRAARVSRAERGGRRSPRLVRITDAIARAGLAPTVVNGVRLAMAPGRGDAATPVRSTILGVTASVAVLAGVVGFSTSLDHLLDRPAAYGWNWDVQVGDPFSPPDFAERGAKNLRDDDFVGAIGYGGVLQMSIDGRRVDVLSMTSVTGGLAPTISAGHAPRGLSELALGARHARCPRRPGRRARDGPVRGPRRGACASSAKQCSPTWGRPEVSGAAR